ncbi:hypothetical protein ACMHYB_39565 [Sorangium sp. So ce1128]
MDTRAIHPALRHLVMLAIGPAFCAAVGITMIHAWIEARRRPRGRRQLARAAARHHRGRERECGQVEL